MYRKMITLNYPLEFEGVLQTGGLPMTRDKEQTNAFFKYLLLSIFFAAISFTCLYISESGRVYDWPNVSSAEAVSLVNRFKISAMIQITASIYILGAAILKLKKKETEK